MLNPMTAAESAFAALRSIAPGKDMHLGGIVVMHFQWGVAPPAQSGERQYRR